MKKVQSLENFVPESKSSTLEFITTKPNVLLNTKQQKILDLIKNGTIEQLTLWEKNMELKFISKIMMRW